MSQLTYTELDFYKSMLNLQRKATLISEQQIPRVHEGKIDYPVDDGRMKETLNDIESLERALAILKQDNS